MKNSYSENIRIHECRSDMYKTNREIATHRRLSNLVKLDVDILASFVIQ